MLVLLSYLCITASVRLAEMRRVICLEGHEAAAMGLKDAPDERKAACCGKKVAHNAGFLLLCLPSTSSESSVGQGIDMAARLTHQEADKIVSRSQSLLGSYRDAAAQNPDEAALKKAAADCLSQMAESFLAQASEDALQQGVIRFGERGLRELVSGSIRIHPVPDAARPGVRSLLAAIDCYLKDAEIAASAEALAPFAAHLSGVVDDAASAMRAGWWILPSRMRGRIYESCADAAQLLESNEGKALEHLADAVHEMEGERSWGSVQEDLRAHPQDFAVMLDKVAPGTLSDETGIAGLSDVVCSSVEDLVQRSGQLLHQVQLAQAIKPGRQDVLAALDACLEVRAGQIVRRAPDAARETAVELYGEDQLTALVKGRIKICPASLDASPSMRRLITEGDRYRLLQKAAEELACEMPLAEDIAALRQKAADARQDLAWLLLAEHEKASVLEAASLLDQLLRSDGGARLTACCLAVRRADAADWLVARRDMDKEPAAIVSALKEVAPHSIADEDSIGGLTDAMAERAARAVKEVGRILDEVKSAKGAKPDARSIEEAADAYRKDKAAKSAASTPIDAINRGSRQFQLKGLKEAGFGTVGSILDVPGYRLEKIPGMGRGVAYEARRMAQSYADYLADAVRIRLSLDDASPAMDGLLAAIGTYRVANDAQKQLKDAKPIIDQIADLRDRVGKLVPDLVWAIMADEDREACIEALNALEAYLAGSEVKALEDAAAYALGTSALDAMRARQEFARNPVGFAATLERIVPDATGSGNGAYGLADELAEKAMAIEFSDADLKVELRPYQVWGVKYILAQKRVLLGDEMGLGKTIQALATMVALRAMGRSTFMVVCPLSVLENWAREIRNKSNLVPLKIYGQDAKQQYRFWQRSYGRVGITTYETLAHLATDGLALDFLVVDEAHYAKNPKAKRTQNVMRFVNVSEYVLFMTGTALENKASEMVQLISMLQPDVAAKAASLVNEPFGDAYREAIAPVYYRRKRSDVLEELPELTESEEWCELSQDEIPAYVEALKEGFAAARRVSWNVSDLSWSGKARRLMEIVEQAQEDDRKVLIFSYFRKTLSDIAELLGQRCIGPINGSISPKERQQMVDRFEDAPAGTALVAQIQAGGTGLNIQAASVVVICEPQCKPSIENQAISRAYRMGQKRKVFVYRLLCAGTIDEKIMELLADKQMIFDTFADASAAAEKVNQTLNQQTMEEIVQEQLQKYDAAS